MLRKSNRSQNGVPTNRLNGSLVKPVRGPRNEPVRAVGSVHELVPVPVAELGEVGVVDGPAVVEVKRGVEPRVGAPLAERVAEQAEVGVVDVLVAGSVAEFAVECQRLGA